MLITIFLLNVLVVLTLATAWPNIGITKKAWQREYARGEAYRSTPILSAPAVAILTGGRAHLLALMLYQLDRGFKNPLHMAVRTLSLTRKADGFQWLRTDFPDLDRALRELEDNGLRANSPKNLHPEISRPYRRYSSTTSWTFILMLLSAAIPFVAIPFHYSAPLEDNAEAGASILAVIASMFLQVTLFMTVGTKAQAVFHQEKALPHCGIKGINTGAGSFFSQRLTQEFGSRADTSADYLVAIHGRSGLLRLRPNLVSEYDWMLKETYAADARRD